MNTYMITLTPVNHCLNEMKDKSVILITIIIIEHVLKIRVTEQYHIRTVKTITLEG